MEFVDVNNILGAKVKKEPDCSAQISSTTANVENKSLRHNEWHVEKEDVNKKNVYLIQWADENSRHNDNYIIFNQVLIANCNQQTVERYLDFVVNGHFLTALLPTEKSENMKECPHCRKKLNPKVFKRHCLYCGKKPDLQCNHCLFKTKYKACLKNHTILVHYDKDKSENNDDLTCSNCDKKLKSKKSLKIHGHYCKNAQYFHCNSCSYYTKRKCNLLVHIESSHSSVSHIACPRCGKKLKNKNSLSVHLTYCGKEPHLHCDNCSYRTKYKREFILHCAKIHCKDVKSIKMDSQNYLTKNN